MNIWGYGLRATGYSQKPAAEAVLTLAVACRLSPVAIFTAGDSR
jgi:hypothetical protein